MEPGRRSDGASSAGRARTPPLTPAPSAGGAAAAAAPPPRSPSPSVAGSGPQPQQQQRASGGRSPAGSGAGSRPPGSAGGAPGGVSGGGSPPPAAPSTAGSAGGGALPAAAPAALVRRSSAGGGYRPGTAVEYRTAACGWMPGAEVVSRNADGTYELRRPAGLSPLSRWREANLRPAAPPAAAPSEGSPPRGPLPPGFPVEYLTEEFGWVSGATVATVEPDGSYTLRREGGLSPLRGWLPRNVRRPGQHPAPARSVGEITSGSASPPGPPSPGFIATACVASLRSTVTDLCTDAVERAAVMHGCAEHLRRNAGLLGGAVGLCTTLLVLDLDGHLLRDYGVELLCGGLRRSRSLRELALRSNGIGCRGLRHICAALCRDPPGAPPAVHGPLGLPEAAQTQGSEAAGAQQHVAVRRPSGAPPAEAPQSRRPSASSRPAASGEPAAPSAGRGSSPAGSRRPSAAPSPDRGEPVAPSAGAGSSPAGSRRPSPAPSGGQLVVARQEVAPAPAAAKGPPASPPPVEHLFLDSNYLCDGACAELLAALCRGAPALRLLGLARNAALRDRAAAALLAAPPLQIFAEGTAMHPEVIAILADPALRAGGAPPAAPQRAAGWAEPELTPRPVESYEVSDEEEEDGPAPPLQPAPRRHRPFGPAAAALCCLARRLAGAGELQELAADFAGLRPLLAPRVQLPPPGAAAGALCVAAAAAAAERAHTRATWHGLQRLRACVYGDEQAGIYPNLTLYGVRRLLRAAGVHHAPDQADPLPVCRWCVVGAELPRSEWVELRRALGQSAQLPGELLLPQPPPGSSAELQGLRAGQVVFEVNGRRVQCIAGADAAAVSCSGKVRLRAGRDSHLASQCRSAPHWVRRHGYTDEGAARASAARGAGEPPAVLFRGGDWLWADARQAERAARAEARALREEEDSGAAARNCTDWRTYGARRLAWVRKRAQEAGPDVQPRRLWEPRADPPRHFRPGSAGHPPAAVRSW
eukprot:TRINITY_DN12173_c0_g1_i4.p1 TRINITY_DN12173_c0_g1~~TRINITY_DN12173_c0_g1_i4.p1  ORF type:complete len:1008 (+),score=220.89 TRINITY_DN12173_c0_g1_i4:71-3025(+)